MVWRPADAEDATQEILIRVLTRLASWRGEARLLTWAYRIGVNYLLNLRRQTPPEAQRSASTSSGTTLADGLAEAGLPRAGSRSARRRGAAVLHPGDAAVPGPRRAGRIRARRDLRAVLGRSGLGIDITPAAYRKRLERARQRLRAFLDSTCGLVNPDAFCRCARRVERGGGSRPGRARQPGLAATRSPARPHRGGRRRPVAAIARRGGGVSSASRTTPPPSPRSTRSRRCCIPGDSRCSSRTLRPAGKIKTRISNEPCWLSTVHSRSQRRAPGNASSKAPAVLSCSQGRALRLGY